MSGVAAKRTLKAVTSVSGFLGGALGVFLYFAAFSLSLESLADISAVKVAGIFASMLCGAWLGIWAGFILWLLVLRYRFRWSKAQVEAVVRDDSSQSIDSLTRLHLEWLYRRSSR